MAKLTLRDLDVKGKKVLMRVDFNVPLENGKITDDNRIVQALQSINYLTDKGCLLILCSHLGRPKGSPDPEYSLKPVADHLAELVDVPVHLAEDCIGEKAETVISEAKAGEIVLLDELA